MNLSVTLADREAEAVSSLLRSHPAVNTHLIHIALIRLGLERTGQDPDALVRELGLIQQDRRNRRQHRKDHPHA